MTRREQIISLLDRIITGNYKDKDQLIDLVLQIKELF